MEKDPKVTIKRNLDGSVSELQIFAVTKPTMQDLIEAIAKAYPGIPMSQLRIEPTMLCTVTYTSPT